VTYLKTGDWHMHVNGGQDTLRIRRIDELGESAAAYSGSRSPAGGVRERDG
jgi:hypothetical protein